MSSSSLTNIQNTILFYGYPTFMSIGYVDSILIILIFPRQIQNTCSIFLISSAMASLLYLSFNCFVQLFPFYYRDESLRTLILCKLRFYLGNILRQLARLLFVAATIDRFLDTSNRANFRAFNTTKHAKWWVFIACIFWPIFACYIPILIRIINGQCSAFDVYATIYTVYVLFVGFVPSSIVAIFGYLTYRHVSKLRTRVQPMFLETREIK